jgi:hypothetical protein
MISRQVLRAEIPPGVQTIRIPTKGQAAPTPATPATAARHEGHTQRLVARRSPSGVMLVSDSEKIPTPAGAPQSSLREQDPSPGQGPSTARDRSGGSGKSSGKHTQQENRISDNTVFLDDRKEAYIVAI